MINATKEQRKLQFQVTKIFNRQTQKLREDFSINLGQFLQRLWQ